MDLVTRYPEGQPDICDFCNEINCAGCAEREEEMEREPVDKKYKFIAINEETKGRVTEFDGIVFKACDNAVLPMLDFYKKRCLDNGCDAKQIACISALVERVKKWRELNPEACKNADVTEKEAAAILGTEITEEHPTGRL
jgi:hypothetical protein